MEQLDKAVVTLSGGLDSLAVLALLLEERFYCIPVFIRYNQTNELKEREAVRNIVRHYQEKRVHISDEVVISVLGMLETNPEKSIPFRNGILISIAASVACIHGAKFVGVGFHITSTNLETRHMDATLQFSELMGSALSEGVEGGLRIEAPFWFSTKSGIVDFLRRVHAPMGLSWSCYRNGAVPCGKCEACRLRALAESSRKEIRFF